MEGWTQKTINTEINKLIRSIDILKDKKYLSAEHMRWMTNVKNIMEDVCGKESRYFRTFSSIEWELTEASALELMQARGLENLQKSQYVKALDISRGLLESLKDYVKNTSIYSSNEYNINWNLIHNVISNVSKSRFDSEHFADSVEAAFKEVNSVVKNIVKEVNGQEWDGADLMNKAFSPNSPIIILSDLSTETGKNIQKGYMQLFAGAMAGIRNPNAHANNDLDKKLAIHQIYFASLLMNVLDERIKP